MRYFRILVAAVAMLSAMSCGIVNHASYAPTMTELNISMGDLDYLGETEISVTYDTYLGVFSKIRSINGKDFDPGLVQYASLPSAGVVKNIFTGLGRHLNRAAYLVYEQYPSAEYFIVTRQTTKKTVLVLGKEVEAKATVRAYRFK